MSDKLNEYEATITLTFKVNVEAKNEELADESVFDFLGELSTVDADNTEIDIKEIK